MIQSEIDNKKILIDLSQTSNKIIQPVFSLKRGQRAAHFPELDHFRTLLHHGGGRRDARPYSRAKNKVFYYKLIFFALSVVFFALSAIVLLKLPALTYWRFYFLNGYIIKNVIGTICGFIGIASLWISNGLTTEKEAAGHIYRKIRASLVKHYVSKKIDSGVHGLLQFGHSYRKLQTLKRSYQDAADAMRKHYSELDHLFDSIARSETLNQRAREELYNQALEEFRHSLENILRSFKIG